jgi:uncharacterized membrane protein YbhN (UPF0104 family)
VAFSVAFVLLLLIRQGGELPRLRSDLRAFGWKLRPGWLVAALAVGMANLFVMGGIWVGLFRALGGTVRFREGVRVWMVTNLGRYIPGKLWQLSGLAFYMRDRRQAGASALTAAALFQLLVLGTGVAVAAITLGEEFLAGGATIPIAVILLLLVLVLARPSLTGSVTRALAGRFGETPPEQPPGARVTLAAAIGLIGAWVGNGVGLWFIWRGAGGGSEPGVLTMAGVFAAAYVAGYLVLIAPGGLVVREGTMAGLLAAAAGVPVSVGAAVAVLARLWAVATELLAAGLAGAIDTRERGEK